MERTGYLPPAMTLADVEAGAADMELSTFGTLRESFVQGALESFGLGTAIRSFAIPSGADAEGAFSATPSRRGPVDLRSTARRMSQEEYQRSPYFRENIPWDETMTEDRAAALASWGDARAVREQRLGQTSGWAAKILGGLAGQALDPINYVPFLGVAARGAAAARFGVVTGRTLTASADAAVNTAVFGALTAPVREQFGDDVSFDRIALDVATAAVIGAAFGSIGGAVEARSIRRRQAALRNVTETHAALNDAVGSLLTEGEVRLAPETVGGLQKVAGVEAPAARVEDTVFPEGPEPLTAPRAAETTDMGIPMSEPEVGIPAAGEAAAPPSQTGLDQLGGDMGRDITRSMYDALWTQVEAGQTKENGAPSALLQAARFVREAGGLTKREEFEALARDYAQIERGPQFQQEMRALVTKYAPDGNAAPRAAPAPKTDLTLPPPAEPNPDLAIAAQTASKPIRNAKELADEFKVDPESGDFDELDDIASLEAQGRLSAAEKQQFDNATEILQRSKVYADALRQAAICGMN